MLKILNIFKAKPIPVALDISASSVKVIALGPKDKQSHKISFVDQQQFGQEAQNIDKLKNALFTLTQRNRFGNLCHVSLPVQLFKFYNLNFPMMAQADLATAIRYKLAQLKPFDLDVSKLDIKFVVWSSLKEKSPAAAQKVLVACIAQQTLEDYKTVLSQYGLKAVSMTAAPFVLAQYAANKTVVLLDLGNEESTLSIIVNGKPAFIKVVNINSKQMNKAMALFTNVAQAEQLKIQYGLGFWSAEKKIPSFYESGRALDSITDKSELTYYALASLLENLVVEIENSFKYFSGQIAVNIGRFNKVVVSGGLSELKNLSQFLSSRLQVPVEKMDVVKIDKLQQPAAFSVCAGINACWQSQNPIDVDFMAGSSADNKNAVLSKVMAEPILKYAVFMLIAGIIISLTQFVNLGYYRFKIAGIERKIKIQQKQLNQYQNTGMRLTKEESDLVNKKAVLDTRLAFLKEEGFRHPAEFTKLLYRISQVVVQDIRITQMVYRETKLEITGQAPTFEAVTRLAQLLKDVGGIQNAEVTSAQKEANSAVYVFKIAAEVQR